MRYLAFLLILCAVDVSAQVQDSKVTTVRESGPGELKLTGPIVSTAGQPLTVVVSGLPAVNMDETIGKQTGWINTIRFEVSSPGQVNITPDAELSMSVSPWEWRLRVTFTPPANGTYLLVCDWNQAPYGLALHRIEVGGKAPEAPENPPPPPNNPPSTRKVRRITYVYEKDQNQVPKPVAAALQAINADGSVVATEFEEDSVDGTGETPDQYKKALEFSKKIGLPSMVIEYDSGEPKVIKDPKTEKEVMEAVSQ